MCGIFGIVGRRADGDAAIMREMGDRLSHRGPDGAAITSSSLGLLGARRLAVVDPHGSMQPVSNERANVKVTLNGEIYNYRALRDRLVGLGHRFATQGDAETIVHAYERYGLDCVEHLHGMFAFALFDEERGRVVLARDPLGKKPLYYAVRGDRLVYASELKALARDPSLVRGIDRRALWHYLTFKNVPSPLTIFEGIRQISPGTIAVYENGVLTLRTYWRPSFTGGAQISEVEAEERCVELLREAVRARMEASDFPVGALLSGGLDSSLITALMAERAETPIKTFALGYAPRVGHKNDVDFAREVAERYGTEHYELTISASVIADELVCALEALDEPFAGAITAFWLSRLVGSHVKVALSGDGADELFGSYASHRHAAAVQAARIGVSGDTSTGTAGLSAGSGEPFGLWRTRFGAFTDEEKRELLGEEALVGEDSSDLLEACVGPSSDRDVVNLALEADCRTLLPDQVLTYVDRLSMAHSLEMRAPFLDLNLVGFVGTLPGAYKVTTGETKRLLRAVGRRFLPDSIVSRRKEGFVLPLDAWLRAELAPLLREVFSPAWMEHALFDTRVIERLMGEHLAGVRDHTYKLWTLLVFQMWYHRVFTRLRESAV